MLHRTPVRLLVAAVVALGACESRSIVVVDVATVTVAPSDTVLFVGDSAWLRAVPRSSGGVPLSNRDAHWTSAAPDIATVDPAGLVHGLAAGAAAIRASVEGVSSEGRVRVLERPVLEARPDAVTITTPSGAESPRVTVDVTNGGGGDISALSVSLAYPEGQPSGWLSAGLNGTSVPTSLTLAASAASLPEGIYGATALLRSPVAGGLLARVDVTLAVVASLPSIELETSGVAFSALEGQGGSPVQQVEVRNGGGGTLEGLVASVEYPEGARSGWLETSLSRSVAPAELTVRARTAGLPAGSYAAEVVLQGIGVAAPARLTVTLTVAPASGSPSASPDTGS